MCFLAFNQGLIKKRRLKVVRDIGHIKTKMAAHSNAHTFKASNYLSSDTYTAYDQIKPK